MKSRYNILIMLVLLIFGMQACTKDFLELEPKTSVSEGNSYKTESDGFLAAVAVYDALAVQNWQFVPIMSDIWSDDCFTGGGNAGDMKQWQEIEQGIISSDNGTVNDLWNRCYSGLYRANLFLQKAEQIEWETPGLKERLVGEVKFLRAYFFWDIVRHYGWAPIFTEILDDVEMYKTVPQNTPDEIFTQIAADLLDAIALLPVSVPDNEKGRVTKGAAQALLARIYLFHEGEVAKTKLGVGSFTNGATTIDKSYVQNALQEIITSGQYRLLDNYADVFSWTNENNDESIFEWQYSEISKVDDWGGWGINGNFSIVFCGPREPQGDPNLVGVEGWSFGTVSWSLVNEFEPGDPRLDVTVYNAEANLTSYNRAFQNTGYFMKKRMGIASYLATEGDPRHNWAINFIDIRYADILLMASELFIDDNPVLALGYLNQVRERAMPGSGLSSIDLDAIYHERRVELAGEGSRKWDLMRRGLNYAETQINASFELPDGISNTSDFSNRLFKENTWGMFPIPGQDIRNAIDGLYKQYVPAYQ